MVILDPALDPEQVDAVVHRIDGVVREAGGVVKNVDLWGLRRLAYPIEGRRDGNYAVVAFEAEPGATRELDRVLKISDAVLRHMIVHKDET